MKKLAIIFVFCLTFTGNIRAGLNQDPEYSFLWNHFSSVRIITDSLALTTNESGLILLKRDDLTGRFQTINHLLLRTRPFTTKRFGDVLAVQTESGIMHFVDLSALPELNLLGEVDIGQTFHDFTLRDNHLYLAAGFDGMRHYELLDYNTLQFKDSSLIGIHCIQLELDGDDLYVLDDYNGIARYDVTANTLENMTDFLFLASRARSFLKLNSTLIIALEDYKRLLLAEWTSGEATITDSIELAGYPRVLFATDTVLLSLDPGRNMIDVINRHDHTRFSVNLNAVSNSMLDGDICRLEGKDYLILPGTELGLSSFLIENLWFDRSPQQVYARPGPITHLQLRDGTLFTAGERNPIDKYIFDADGRPVLDTTLYGLDNVKSIAGDGNLQFVLYPDVNHIFVLRFSEDSIRLVNTIPVDGSAISHLQYYHGRKDSLSMLLAIKDFEVDIYQVADESDIKYVHTTRLLAKILKVLVDHNRSTLATMMAISTENREVSRYRIFDDFSVLNRRTVSTPENLYELSSVDISGSRQQILGFSGTEMYRLDLPPNDLPQIEWLQSLPINVTAVVSDYYGLYTIGEQGIGIFDLNQETPQLIEYGGFGGHLISVEDDRLAISDGTAIHLYKIESLRTDIFANDISRSLPGDFLLPNYPNPFNPSTRIEYSLSHSAHVEVSILNLLGQTIATLTDKQQAAGHHTVVWNGQDHFGNRVASGTYFYRLITPDVIETRKMMLIK